MAESKSKLWLKWLIIKAITPSYFFTHSIHRQPPSSFLTYFTRRQFPSFLPTTHRQLYPSFTHRWRSKNISSCSLQPSKKCLSVLALNISVVMSYLSYTHSPTFLPIALSNPSFAMHGGWNVHLLTLPYLSLFPTYLQLALSSLSLYAILSPPLVVPTYRVYGVTLSTSGCNPPNCPLFIYLTLRNRKYLYVISLRITRYFQKYFHPFALFLIIHP